MNPPPHILVTDRGRARIRDDLGLTDWRTWALAAAALGGLVLTGLALASIALAIGVES